jgi:hypothetical protein
MTLAQTTGLPATLESDRDARRELRRREARSAPSTRTRCRAARTWRSRMAPPVVPTSDPDVPGGARAEVKTLGSDNPDALETRNDLASAFGKPAGRPRQPPWTKTCSVGAKPLSVPIIPCISSRGNLALDYSALGRRDEAIALAKTLEARPISATTTPTPSSAASTWPICTRKPAGRPASRSTRRRFPS